MVRVKCLVQEPLRVALFSGNYNYVKDGANGTLNRLVGHLLKRGIPVRIYSPTSDTPAFPPTGDLVSVPSVSIPRRREYRLALGMPRKVRDDLDAFAPTLIHVSSPDLLGCAALRYAQQHELPAVASYHTRFETYLGYYGLGWLEPGLKLFLNRFYARCQRLYVPTACTASLLRADGIQQPVDIWHRGVDRALFSPNRRDPAWRASLGIAPDEPVLLFVGRLVREKGLDVFVAAADALAARGVRHRVVVVGDGPERESLRQALPLARFTGFLTGEALARAYASADMFFNPSVTEAFGNVTLEAMASGLPTVCVDATGSHTLVHHGETGYLVPPGNLDAAVDRLAALAGDLALRHRMGDAGRRASAHYDWDTLLDGVLRSYRDVIAGWPPLTTARLAPAAARMGDLLQPLR